MSDDRLDPWISLRRAADLMELPVWTARRRLHTLNDAVGGGVLRRFTDRGRIYVDVGALLYHLRNDPKESEDDFDELRAKVEDLERKILALRNAHRHLRRRVDASQ